VASAADGVPEQALIAEPVPDIQPIVGDAVAVARLDTAAMVDVPGRLPLRRLEGEVERAEVREVDARGEIGLAEQVVVPRYGVVAGVLEVHRKGRAAREDEAAADPALLLADDMDIVSEPGALRPAGVEEGLEDVLEGLPAGSAAAPHDDALCPERPTAHRLEREVQAAEFRIAAGERAVRELDIVRVRHAREEIGRAHV